MSSMTFNAVICLRSGVDVMLNCVSNTQSQLRVTALCALSRLKSHLPAIHYRGDDRLVIVMLEFLFWCVYWMCSWTRELYEMFIRIAPGRIYIYFFVSSTVKAVAVLLGLLVSVDQWQTFYECVSAVREVGMTQVMECVFMQDRLCSCVETESHMVPWPSIPLLSPFCSLSHGSD